MARLKNKRWERFCRAYVNKGFNASAAARAVGYSVISAGTQGSRLLQNDLIIQRIGELTDDINNDSIMTADELMVEASKLAAFDLAKLTDENGALIPVHELDDEVTSSLNEIETDEDGIITKVKAGRDKKFGMDLVAKFHNVLEEHQKAGAMIVVMDDKDAKA